MRSKQRIKEFGEVFTPARVVYDMLKLLPPECWSTPKQFLEPACGNGAFVLPIIQIRYRSICALHEKPCDLMRIKILATAVCDVVAADLLQDNVDECRERVLALVRSKYDEFTQLPDRIDLWFRAAIRHHVFRADALKTDFTARCRFDALPFAVQNDLMLELVPKILVKNFVD